MSETWTISVGGRAYGPYTLDQMRAFHAEGRLAAHSLAARAGEEQFHPAGEDPELAALFPDAAPAPLPEIRAEAPISPELPHKFGRDGDADGERNRYVIISDMKSGSISALEEEIFNLGPAYRFMPQAWILTSDISLSSIRGGLIQKLGKLDTLFVVDTAHDKAAWFNFGPEADTKVRRLWSRAPEMPARKVG